MSTPAIYGILMVVGAVVAAYWMGHSAGFQAGQGAGFDDGKREGAREGSMRGYAVGFDRGRRGPGEDGEEGRKPSIGFGVVALAVGVVAIFVLAAQSRNQPSIRNTASPTVADPIEKSAPASDSLVPFDSPQQATQVLPRPIEGERQLVPVPTASPAAEPVESNAKIIQAPKSPW